MHSCIVHVLDTFLINTARYGNLPSIEFRSGMCCIALMYVLYRTHYTPFCQTHVHEANTLEKNKHYKE